MFLVSSPSDAPVAPEALAGRLEALGVQVDKDYGAVPIDLERSRFVLRGTASRAAVEALAGDPSFQIFADPQIGDI